jgi:phage/plasmid-like protein (TIGR03299 family)
MQLSRLDWPALLESVHDSSGHIIEGQKLVVRGDLPREDTRRHLGIVGDRYTPIQNVDAFGFADALIGEGGARFESAGSLRNGRIVWLLVQMPNKLNVKDDTINKYLLLKNTHDGTGALQAMLTPVRVVCWNTLSAAIRGARNIVNIRHTASAMGKVNEARRILGAADEYFGALAAKLDKMTDRVVNADEVWEFVHSLVPKPADASKPDTRGENTRREIVTLFAGGQQGGQMVAARQTAYGLYNAAVEYADHHRTVRVTGEKSEARKDEARMESTLWGSAADFKQRAYNLCAQLADPADSIIESLNLDN